MEPLLDTIVQRLGGGDDVPLPEDEDEGSWSPV
jgi:hypothetical protein